ncbi:MAG: hypothetical protein ABI679_08275 [Gemmatimonadota bacterium]
MDIRNGLRATALSALLAGVLGACNDSSDPASPTLLAANAGVPAPYTLVDLAVPGEFNGFGADINDGGTVLGTSSMNGPWLRLISGARVDIGHFTGGVNGNGNALNNLEQATGFSYNADSHAHAFFWSQSGGMIDLGTLANNRGASEGNGINNLGQVVGSSSVGAFPSTASHAFLWSDSTGMADLGTLGGSFSSARDINDQGEVVGESDLAATGPHAFYWSQATGMVDIGTLGGQRSFANGINNKGQVVGESEAASGVNHAFLWTQAGGMVDLGTMDSSSTAAEDINERGQIVGTSFNGTFRAFLLKTNGTYLDLGDLGGGLSRGLAINKCGLISGSSQLPSGGTGDHAVLWMKPC